MVAEVQGSNVCWRMLKIGTDRFSRDNQLVSDGSIFFPSVRTAKVDQSLLSNAC